MKVDFPKFDRDNPSEWVYRAQQFFVFHQTNPLHRILIFSFHMEGRALTWFKNMEESDHLTSWDAFVKALLTRFGPSAYDDPMEALTQLRQITIVEV